MKEYQIKRGVIMDGAVFLTWFDLCYFLAFFHSFSKDGNLASREVS